MIRPYDNYILSIMLNINDPKQNEVYEKYKSYNNKNQLIKQKLDSLDEFIAQVNKINTKDFNLCFNFINLLFELDDQGSDISLNINNINNNKTTHTPNKLSFGNMADITFKDGSKENNINNTKNINNITNNNNNNVVDFSFKASNLNNTKQNNEEIDDSKEGSFFEETNNVFVFATAKKGKNFSQKAENPLIKDSSNKKNSIFNFLSTTTNTFKVNPDNNNRISNPESSGSRKNINKANQLETGQDKQKQNTINFRNSYNNGGNCNSNIDNKDTLNNNDYFVNVVSQNNIILENQPKDTKKGKTLVSNNNYPPSKLIITNNKENQFKPVTYKNIEATKEGITNEEKQVINKVDPNLTFQKPIENNIKTSTQTNNNANLQNNQEQNSSTYVQPSDLGFKSKNILLVDESHQKIKAENNPFKKAINITKPKSKKPEENRSISPSSNLNKEAISPKNNSSNDKQQPNLDLNVNQVNKDITSYSFQDNNASGFSNSIEERLKKLIKDPNFLNMKSKVIQEGSLISLLNIGLRGGSILFSSEFKISSAYQYYLQEQSKI